MVQAGEYIAGRFLLEREVARGGMGAIWLGQDQKLRRQVAIKLLMAQGDPSANLKVRFEREAMAVAQLKSPHVVQIFDYGVERGMAYIVMELLEGEDLHARLKRMGRLPIEAIAQIVWQTAKALSVAHAAGIIHRDMKPANVFLVRQREEELVKVLDFGVAKAAIQGLDEDTEKTREGAILGTPQFMSPEQARGFVNALDHRSDLWSLGVIIYRALTGQLPFNGATINDQIIKICTEPLTPASSLLPGLPPAFDEFFAKGLAREPEHRFGSAREMAVAFCRLAPGNPTSLDLPDGGAAATRGDGPGWATPQGTWPSFPGGNVALPASWSGAQPTGITSPGMPPPPAGQQVSGSSSGGQGPVTGQSSVGGTHPSLGNGFVATQAQPAGTGSRTALVAVLGATVAIAAVGGVLLFMSPHKEPPTAAPPERVAAAEAPKTAVPAAPSAPAQSASAEPQPSAAQETVAATPPKAPAAKAPASSSPKKAPPAPAAATAKKGQAVDDVFAEKD